MAIVGHFANLAEAQKLVQSQLLAGVVQETYEEGQLLQKLPVLVINAKSLLYNRESTLPSAAFYDIHESLPWSSDVDYATQVEVTLKTIARQDILDEYIMKTYKNPNDYRSIVMSQLRKGIMRTLEDKMVYGDATTYTKEFDGLDKLCAASGGSTFGTAQDYDQGGATNGVSFAIMQNLITQCKPKPDVLLMTNTLANRITNAVWTGINANVNTGLVSYGQNQFGMRVEYFNGIPILRSDFLSTENDNTGGYLASGDLVSMYAVRFGQVQDGGLCMIVGGDTGGVEFFKMVELEALEDYLAAGIRLYAFCALALGSTKAISRIHSIDQTVAVAA